MTDQDFWSRLAALVSGESVVVDRPSSPWLKAVWTELRVSE